MKVLLINSVCGIRSTGRICTDLAEVLEKYGHECKIAYGRENVPDKYKKYAHRICTDTDIKIDALKTRIFDNAGFNSKKVTIKFIEWIKEYNPDVINIHNIHGYYLNIEILFDFLKEFGKPIFWTLHDCWSFTGHCSHFDFIGCEKWCSGGCSDCIQKRKYPASLLKENSKKNFKLKKEIFTGVKHLTLVSPSKWLADIVSKSFLKEYPVRVIPNGIDLSVFKPNGGNFRKKFGLEGKKVVLGVASTWDSRKGFDDFLHLADKLSDEYKIVLVGLTKKQAEKLPEKIVGITRTNSAEELAEIYTAADIFINTTYEDNYPTVNLEAQACGTPAVTYRTGGSVESVPDSSVVEQGDINGLIEKICNLDSLGISDMNFNKQDRYKEYMNLFGERNEATVYN